MCRYLKFYDDTRGDTLTLWSRYNRPHWQRFVLRYDDIVSYHQTGIHLELIMRIGSVMISGLNLPRLELLLEQRVVRSIREMPENQIESLDDPVYEQCRDDVLTHCIYPIAMLFSATGMVYDPPEKVPVGVVLN